MAKGNPNSEQGGEAVNQGKEAAQPQHRVNPLLGRIHRFGPVPGQAEPSLPRARGCPQSCGAWWRAGVQPGWTPDNVLFAQPGTRTHLRPRQSFRSDFDCMHIFVLRQRPFRSCFSHARCLIHAVDKQYGPKGTNLSNYSAGLSRPRRMERAFERPGFEAARAPARSHWL